MMKTVRIVNRAIISTQCLYRSYNAEIDAHEMYIALALAHDQSHSYTQYNSVALTWNRSNESSKFITFGPINESKGIAMLIYYYYYSADSTKTKRLLSIINRSIVYGGALSVLMEQAKKRLCDGSAFRIMFVHDLFEFVRCYYCCCCCRCDDFVSFALHLMVEWLLAQNLLFFSTWQLQPRSSQSKAFQIWIVIDVCMFRQKKERNRIDPINRIKWVGFLFQ